MKRTRGLGVLYQRGPVWWLQYSVRGKRHRESSGSANRADAVRLLRRRIAEAQAGKAIGPQIERTTLGDLCNMVLDDYRARGRRSLVRAEFAIAHLRRFFGDDARAIDITNDRVTAFRAQRQDQGAAPATVNASPAMLRRGFRLAPDAGKVAVVPKISTPSPENGNQLIIPDTTYPLGGAIEAAVRVRLEVETLAPGVIVVGENMQVTPAGGFVQLNEIVPLNPPLALALIEILVDCPGATFAVCVERASVKSADVTADPGTSVANRPVVCVLPPAVK